MHSALCLLHNYNYYLDLFFSPGAISRCILVPSTFSTIILLFWSKYFSTQRSRRRSWCVSYLSFPHPNRQPRFLRLSAGFSPIRSSKKASKCCSQKRKFGKRNDKGIVDGWRGWVFVSRYSETCLFVLCIYVGFGPLSLLFLFVL